MKLRTLFLFFCFATMFSASNCLAAEARAWLDRSNMHMGETVTLNVEVSNNANAGKPDFSALEPDFNLLGTQSSTSMRIENGQSSSTLLWAVGLEPKHPGTLTIPALTVAGTQTQPMSVIVQGALVGASGKAGDDIFLEFEAAPLAPYVQQQVRLTVKLYYATNLSDGNLDDPKADGLAIRKLGQDSNFMAEVGGRRYRVLERHYVASAEKSGNLDIPALAFRGRALDPGDVNSFFSRGREVSARSPAISLGVRARPQSSGSDMWLPAQSLTLSAEGIDGKASVHAGEPLTLTLRLKAQGLGFEQLPELKLPAIDGADVYPDKESTQNRDDGSGVIGQRERKFAIVPSRAGTLNIPAVGIAWWDTEHDRAASSDVPALSINVLPAIGNANANTNAGANGAASNAPADAANPASVNPPSAAFDAADAAELRMWRSVAIGALLLWVITLLALIAGLIVRRRSARLSALPVAVPQSSNAEKVFRLACSRGSAADAARALLQWARKDQPALRNLGELARALTDDTQVLAVRSLEKALYSEAGTSTTAVASAASAFRAGIRFKPDSTLVPIRAAVPDLYPFKT